MSIKTLILGNSGTGKSASLRDFEKDEIAVINCAGKPLPFQNDFEQYVPDYKSLTDDVVSALDQTNKKIIVVDDAQYIMSFQYMRRIHENGWDKWNDIQGDFFKIIQLCDYLPKDTTVYFLSHLTKDDDGNEKIKTMGKMLDEKITIEGLFTTVLKTSVQDGKYYFLTQNSGKDTVKSPIGMFDSYAIDNNLKYVDLRIRNYYKLDSFVTDEEIEKMAESVNAPEIEKPDGKRKRRTRTKPAETENTPEVEKPAESEKKEVENEEIKEETNKEPVKEEKVEAEGKPAETIEKPKRKRRFVEGEQSGEQLGEQSTTTDEESVPETSTESVKPKRRKRRKPAESTMNDEDIPF